MQDNLHQFTDLLHYKIATGTLQTAPSHSLRKEMEVLFCPLNMLNEEMQVHVL